MVEDRRPETARAYLWTNVRYGKMGLIGRFKTDRADLRMRDPCIVRSERGREVGTVVSPLEPVPEGMSLDGVGEIIRKATPDDRRNIERIERETRLKELQCCREEAKKLGLQMKVVEVDHIFGGERVIVYFVSETRIDFRELVRRLAHEFRSRIELKQIGARDHARLVGDVGMCGRPTACRTYRKELGGITMDMAKVQKHTADPSKITGVCGKLRCCLRFEYPAYAEARDLLPPKGARIETQRGNGPVVEQNLLLREVTILPEGRENRVVVRLDEIVGNPAGAAGCGGCPAPRGAAEDEEPVEREQVEDAKVSAAPIVAEPEPEPAPASEPSPSAFVWVGRQEDLAPGKGRAVQVRGRPLALFNVDGRIHAIEGACPHQGGPLAEGTLEGTVVTCPLHRWQFDVVTGKGASGPSFVRTFEVKVERGQIYVRV